MRYIKYFIKYLLENNNSMYDGLFTYNVDDWKIVYNDYEGHYITDKLVNRNGEKTSDPVKDINNIVIRIISYNGNDYENVDYLNWGVKFKNKKYIVCVEVYPNKKILEIKTIRSLDMGVDRRSTFINIDNKDYGKNK